MNKLIGEENRTSALDPGLAERLNQKAEEEDRREELEKKRKELEKRRKNAEEEARIKEQNRTEEEIRKEQEAERNKNNPNTTSSSSLISTGNYILMPQANTYALGLHALQQACIAEGDKCQQPQIQLPDGRKVYRANTFLENILARMNDWETLTDSNGNNRTEEERKEYFQTWLDSCGGVAYQARSTRLKLQLICPQLMGIDKEDTSHFLPVNYANFSGQEFDSSHPNFVHDGWLYLLEGRTDVYTDYLKILKTITQIDITPGFWKRKNTSDDELRALYVIDLIIISNVIGNNDLINNGSFLRVAHR
jgi:hypothetical protein